MEVFATGAGADFLGSGAIVLDYASATPSLLPRCAFAFACALASTI